MCAVGCPHVAPALRTAVHAITLNFLAASRSPTKALPSAASVATRCVPCLAYLAVEADQPHARTSLAALFWPDQPESLALGNLPGPGAPAHRTRGRCRRAAARHPPQRAAARRRPGCDQLYAPGRQQRRRRPGGCRRALSWRVPGRLWPGGLRCLRGVVAAHSERLLQLALSALERLADLHLAAAHTALPLMPPAVSCCSTPGARRPTAS